MQMLLEPSCPDTAGILFYSPFRFTYLISWMLARRYVWGPHTRLMPGRGQKMVSNAPKLNLQMGVSSYVCVVNWTWVLCKKRCQVLLMSESSLYPYNLCLRVSTIGLVKCIARFTWLMMWHFRTNGIYKLQTAWISWCYRILLYPPHTSCVYLTICVDSRCSGVK